MSSLPAPETSALRSHAPALVARTVLLDTSDPLLAFLPEAGPDGVLSWVRNGIGLVGWGRVLEFSATGPGRFAEAEQWWHDLATRAVVRDEVGVHGTGLVCFGSFPFADDSAEPARLVVPSTIVGRRDGQTWLTSITVDPQLAPVASPTPTSEPAAPEKVTFADGDVSPADYAHAVGEAVRRISSGDLDKVVLARDLVATAAEPLDPRWLLRRLADRYENTWVFSVAGLVGATPELLVRRDQGLVT